MNELSIFIDESGDFGEYDYRSPYYIIAMVFHKQEHSIHEAVDKLNHELSYMGLNNLCIHTGPIIRREEIYTNMDIHERRRIFNKMIAFIRQVDIRYRCFFIEKKNMVIIVMSSFESQSSTSEGTRIRSGLHPIMTWYPFIRI